MCIFILFSVSPGYFMMTIYLVWLWIRLSQQGHDYNVNILF